MGIESPVHLLFFAAVALIVLGPKRLPALAKALGQGIREFRESLTEGALHERPAEPPAALPAPATVQVAPVVETPAASTVERASSGQEIGHSAGDERGGG